jgi:hypothetical protein
MTTIQQSIKPKAPEGSGRQPVLAEPADAVAKKVVSDPGNWYLVASGDITRLGTISQTAYRIRRRSIAAFARQTGGSFEVRVSTDMDVPREAAVEMFLRWVPVS